MTRGWLLVETLGPQLVVAAQGHQLRKLIPLHTYLKRSPLSGEIADAVLSARHSAVGSIRRSTQGSRVIRTEPVAMTDGRIHGVHVWTGSDAATQPLRPVIGCVIWDLTAGTATDTPDALRNSGFDPDNEQTHGRALAEDLSIGDVHPSEGQLLALTMNCRPGETLCTAWDIRAPSGEPVRVNFTARAALEPSADGTKHLIARAMNWQSPVDTHADREPHLAERILRGMAQDGIHRALVDLKTSKILKWLDPPCPHFDWRGEEAGRPLVHPDDEAQLQSLVKWCENGPAAGALRLRAKGGWALIHLTMYRIELDKGTYAGLIAARLPTPADLAVIPEPAVECQLD